MKPKYLDCLYHLQEREKEKRFQLIQRNLHGHQEVMVQGWSTRQPLLITTRHHRDWFDQRPKLKLVTLLGRCCCCSVLHLAVCCWAFKVDEKITTIFSPLARLAETERRRQPKNSWSRNKFPIQHFKTREYYVEVRFIIDQPQPLILSSSSSSRFSDGLFYD